MNLRAAVQRPLGGPTSSLAEINTIVQLRVASSCGVPDLDL